MGKSAPAAPPPPDPYRTAQAQTGSNIETAIANQIMGNVDTYGPMGSTVYRRIPGERIGGNPATSIRAPGGPGDGGGGGGGGGGIGPGSAAFNAIAGGMGGGTPGQGGGYEIPRYEQVTTLSPSQQLLFDQNFELGKGMNYLAMGQVDRLGNVLGQPVSAAGLPAMSGAPSTATTDFSAGVRGMPVTNFAAGLPTDFSADRSRVEQAMFDRLNPQLERDRAAEENRLVNQGFVRGTEAFNSAMDAENRKVNDARLAITGQGLAEQQGMYGMARDRAGFGASEEARAFDQAMAGAQFGSGEQNRAFNTGMAGAQFGNQARQQALQEMLALRNQPINEITALMSGGQVSLPNVPQYNAPQVANTDIGGYVYNSAALNQKNYESKLAQQNAMMGGLFGLGQAGILGAMGPGAFGKKLWGG